MKLYKILGATLFSIGSLCIAADAEKKDEKKKESISAATKKAELAAAMANIAKVPVIIVCRASVDTKKIKDLFKDDQQFVRATFGEQDENSECMQGWLRKKGSAQTVVYIPEKLCQQDGFAYRGKDDSSVYIDTQYYVWGPKGLDHPKWEPNIMEKD